jgi:ubiquinone/menaquinone biosynthesis C-methylase UbiE
MLVRMEARGIECTAIDNHLWSLGRFVDLLKQEGPASVLDVGCGSGRLLRSVFESGIAATGLDRAGPQLDMLRAEALDVREGSAYALPFDDRSFDWVTLRHVPHHLEHPERAIDEVLRVARAGALIAEPAFELGLASQRTAHALDLWEKRQDRRGGMYHAEVYELGPLLGLFPAAADSEFEIESRRFMRLRQRSVVDFASEATARIADLPPDHAEHAALNDLIAACERDGLSWSGSLCVIARRRRRNRPR